MAARQITAAVAELQTSIQRYDPQLTESEYLTRKVLVDPVLKILGWEIPTPGRTEVEYQYADKRADYALFIRGVTRPVCFIEAKRKGANLRLEHLDYRARLNEQRYYADHLILTDGDTWKVYDTYPGRIDENLRTEIRIAGQNPVTCADRLIELSQLLQALESSSAPDALAWAPIGSITTAPKAIKPRAIHFPDGEQKQTPSLYKLVEHTAHWLWANGALTQAHTPIPVNPCSTNYFIRADANGNSGQWQHIGTSGLFVRTDLGQDSPSLVQELLRHCGQSTEGIYIQGPA